jgi:hypothetical protein
MKKEYVKFWPRSKYNDELNEASIKAIDFLYSNPMKPNSAIVFGLDDTLLYCEAGFIELEDRHGNEILIVPVNNEIKRIVEFAEELGYAIIIMSSRSQTYFASSKMNLRLFDVHYDEMYHNTNLEVSPEEYRQNTLEKLKTKYDIAMCVNSHKSGTCEGSFFVKLPYFTD